MTSYADAPPEVETTEVVIAGGGPVGLTLAHELGARGIGCVLLEPRPAPSLASPRCKQLNPRSMELFRRLGIAGAVRDNAPLPFGWSDSAVFCTSLTGHRLERFDGVFALSDVQRTELAEPALWCAQNHVEEALRDTITRRETVSARWGWTLTGLEQDATGVTATATDDTGRERVVRGRYLVGADGPAAPSGGRAASRWPGGATRSATSRSSSTRPGCPPATSWAAPSSTGWSTPRSTA